MNIKTAYLLLVPLFVLFTITAVYAANADQAEKFFQKTCAQTNLKGINAFVCDLRLRLDALTAQVENIPAGPQGPQGEAGPQGEPGEPGSQGPAGPRLIVKDANGQVIGPVYDPLSFATVIRLWDTNRSAFITVNPQTGQTELAANLGDTFYTEPNCAGTPYADARPYRIYGIQNGANKNGWTHVKVQDYSKLAERHIVSEWQSGSCAQLSTNMYLAEIEPTTAPPTYAAPLSIVEE